MSASAMLRRGERRSTIVKDVEEDLFCLADIRNKYYSNSAIELYDGFIITLFFNVSLEASSRITEIDEINTILMQTLYQLGNNSCISSLEGVTPALCSQLEILVW
jgi:hypothetical protein